MHPHHEVATFFHENAEEIASLGCDEPSIPQFSAVWCDRETA
jgi:hypothetical protein